MVQPLWVYDDTRQNRLGAGKQAAHATASGITAALAAAEASTNENATIAAVQTDSAPISPSALPNAVTGMEELFGDGRDGVMPASGNLDYNNGFGVGSANGSGGSTFISVVDRGAVGRINPGDVVLIHQTRGSGAGNWELNKATSGYTSGGFWLARPLAYNYVTNGGAERAQLMRVPQYTDCPVSGTVTPLTAWNGYVGGLFAILCSGTATINGSINATEYGYWGGDGAPDQQYSHQAEGTAGERACSSSPNGNGGGGGLQAFQGGNGGGGGGNGTAGVSGTGQSANWGPGQGGSGAGNAELTNLVFGGGGGGGGRADQNRGAGGGNGGGIIVIYARNLSVGGSISANGGKRQGNCTGGGSGNEGGGGGGAGGAIKIVAQTATLGNGLIAAIVYCPRTP